MTAAPWPSIPRGPRSSPIRRRAALFVDFDGSLAPIVDDPASAVPLPAAVDACTRLAARLGRVAVVSGRPVAFVRHHLPDPAIVVVGEYGLEIDRDGVTIADPRTIPFERRGGGRRRRGRAPLAPARDRAQGLASR